MKQRLIREVIAGQQLVVVSPELSIQEAAFLMGRERLGALPVVDDGRLVGIFTERDALVRVLGDGRDPAATCVGDVMTPAPQCIDAGQRLALALFRMHQGGFRHMPVVEAGQLVGMVSARDALGPELSELDAQVEQFEQVVVQIR